MITDAENTFNQPQDASTNALAFAKIGMSVIPLASDSKRPALKSWGQFQQIRPSQRQLAYWFIQAAPSAYGLICGRVSGIIVLDFDEKIHYERFIGLFPHLLNTLIVQTGGRGGYHLYYQVDYAVKSQQIQGGDLQAEGKYVVGAGSVINGKTWQIIHHPPSLHALTKDQLTAVLAAFGTTTPCQTPLPLSSHSNDDFAAEYRNRVAASGQRNNTLFQVACLMRNRGCLVTDTIAALAKLHTHTPPQRGQRQESPKQRYREAIATIHSAYTASPVISHDTKTSHLPNRLREGLLSLAGGTAFLRVYEGLLLNNIHGTISRQFMIDTLKGIVGRHSIDTALELTDSAGQKFFTPLVSPAEADTQITPRKNSHSKEKPTALVCGKKRIQHYQMPSVEALCEQLHIVNHSGDAITLNDLKSAKGYRLALHDAFIRRRPGQHSQKMLASRVGRSPRTIRTYGKDLGHQVKPTFTRQCITFKSLDKLMYLDEGERKPIWGQYLEDENGKRYKPYREIAAQLLKKGHAVNLCRQGMSLYAAKGVDFDIILRPVNAIKPQPKSWCEMKSPHLRTFTKPQPVFVNHSAVTSAHAPVVRSVLAVTSPQPSIPKYANPLPDSQDEAAADRLHTTFSAIPLSSARWIVERCGRKRALQLMHRIQKMEVKNLRAYLVKAAQNAASDSAELLKREQSARRKQRSLAIEQAARRLHDTITTISLVNARELVLTYGIEAVEATLRHMDYISSPERQQPYVIRSRAGFFLSHIRQAWRRLNNAQDFSKPAPKFKPHQPRKRTPKYDPKREFMRMARRGKTINWSYLEWRANFHAENGLVDQFQAVIDEIVAHANRQDL